MKRRGSNTPKAVSLAAELEAMTAEAGGRIYLAKDSLASASTIRKMYPEHGDWLNAVQAADPEGRYITDLIRRLNLRDGP